MEDKLSAKKVSLSLAIVTGIFSTVCALLIFIAPPFVMNLFSFIFHGIDISQIVKPITFIDAILGIIEVIILGLIAGWLFVKVYNFIKR
ncbi:MAG TPA: DUF5676 family membrane protein [Candidatus Nanoarchaeia archaeon]|nr:DUF5676 family membrane protein [Candidatus Nanoarchaeia archaeon]